jgi:hypothetical protein
MALNSFGTGRMVNSAANTTVLGQRFPYRRIGSVHSVRSRSSSSVVAKVVHAAAPAGANGSLREEQMRTRLGLTVLLWLAAAIQVGCIVPIFSSSQDVRARQLIFVSEGYRHIPEIWERMWFLDSPDTMTPYRTHGGII